MSELDRQVRHARRRLTGNLFLDRLALGTLLAAGLWAIAILLVRTFGWPAPVWHGFWAAAGLAGAFAGLATWLTRPSPLRAAAALDSAAGLKERLSTALVVRRAADPFAQAAVRDAEWIAGRVHVPAHIRYRAPRLWSWSVATMAAALLLAWFMPTLSLFAKEEPPRPTVSRAELEAEQQAIKAEMEDQAQRLRQMAKDNAKLADLAAELESLKLPEGPNLAPEDIRRDAVKKLDAVGEKLRRELENTETNPLSEMKRMLSQLEPLGGDKSQRQLGEALAAGDFEGARQALQKMAEELREAAEKVEDPAAKERLAALEEQLARLAEQMNRLENSAALEKELQNKGGLSQEEAKELLDQMAKIDPEELEKALQQRLGQKMSAEQLRQLAQKMQQNQQAKQACQNLAQSLSKAAKACKACQNPGAGNNASASASAALSDAASQLSQMEMAEQLAAELQARLSDLENLREGVCEGNCQRPGDAGNRIGGQGPQYGLGYGSRIGKEPAAYKTDPTKALTRFQGGSITGQMLIPGPQVRGEATAEVYEAARAQVRDALDAIEREEVPRQYRKVLQEYFERLAGVLRDENGATQAPP